MHPGQLLSQFHHFRVIIYPMPEIARQTGRIRTHLSICVMLTVSATKQIHNIYFNDIHGRIEKLGET